MTSPGLFHSRPFTTTGFFLQVKLQVTTGGACNSRRMNELTHTAVTKITCQRY
jgi:hypothetical protein